LRLMQSQRLNFFNGFSIQGVSIILELAPLPRIRSFFYDQY